MPLTYLSICILLEEVWESRDLFINIRANVWVEKKVDNFPAKQNVKTPIVFCLSEKPEKSVKVRICIPIDRPSNLQLATSLFLMNMACCFVSHLFSPHSLFSPVHKCKYTSLVHNSNKPHFCAVCKFVCLEQNIHDSPRQVTLSNKQKTCNFLVFIETPNEESLWVENGISAVCLHFHTSSSWYLFTFCMLSLKPIQKRGMNRSNKRCEQFKCKQTKLLKITRRNKIP